VLDGQVRRANGGLTDRSVGEFRAAIDFQLTDDDSGKAFGCQGLGTWNVDGQS
jgi:hypothetical protein